LSALAALFEETIIAPAITVAAKPNLIFDFIVNPSMRNHRTRHEVIANNRMAQPSNEGCASFNFLDKRC